VGDADRRIASLAERQHGVVARSQLIDLGLGHGAIDRRIASGRLHTIHRGVYAVGHRRMGAQGRWMAAVLAGGTSAALSHRSAAELWELLTRTDARPHVTLPLWRRRLATRGMTWHCGVLPADERTVRDGIPVTSVPRTLLDLACVAPRETLERAVNEAEFRRYDDALSLPALLARYPRRHGTAALRAIVGAGGIGTLRTRSELERAFLSFVRRHRLPRPELNAAIWLGDRFVEADCIWRASRLVVELDARATHGTVAAFERDRARDRALHVAGWRTIRVTERQLAAGGPDLARDLRALLSQEAGPPGL
jgi:very-short-patch-repair endonuclease